MKIIKSILFIVIATVVIIFQAGCSDDLTEIKEINYDRVFSPTNLEATVVNNTNVRLRWTRNSSAESYTVELFADDSLSFAGNPVKTIEGITSAQIPYLIEGLAGETRYSARMKSVNSTTNDSKWTGVTFLTGAENILLPFQDGDIQATSVTFRWPAGQQVTHITLEPGSINRPVTAAEVAAGVAIVEGLTGETTYGARLMNDAKVRAITTFTTLVDIGDAIAVYPEDDFIAMLASASDGDAFALFPGEYGDASKFVVNKQVEIKAVYPYDKPILKGYFALEGNSSLLLQSVVLDGAGLSDGNQAIVFATAQATYGNITLEGSEIRNHVKGLYYLNVVSLVESITINNCLIHDIVSSGGDFMDSRTGAIKKLTLSNSTIYNSVTARDMIRMDNASANFPGVSPQIIVDKNTIYNVSNGANRRLLYVRYTGHSIIFTNNIVAETLAQFSNQGSTAIPTFENNNYHNAPGLHSGGLDASGARFFDDTGLQEDPLFENPAGGNFKVGNDLIIEKGIGDPRWR